MKPLANWAVGAASCCFVLAASLAHADEVRLSDSALDSVTAAAGPLFGSPGGGGGLASNAQFQNSLFASPPASPAPPTSNPSNPPAPSAPPSVSETADGAQASIFIPSAPAGSLINAILGANSGNGTSSAVAGLEIASDTGGEVSSLGLRAQSFASFD